MSDENNTPEQQPFQAEVQQLLDIVIHSLYTDREIFVRELVSNASDAISKLEHIQLTENDIADADQELQITIESDEEAKTVTFTDAGLGMTRDELVENLGTIAHSGSKQFVNAMKAAAADKDGKESQLIGQFGVGFYSAFMVADKVEVFTKSYKAEGEPLRWESDGKTGYTITEAADADLKRGTKIVVYLKDEFEEFSKTDTLTPIVKKHSSFAPFPILIGEERVNTVDALWLKSKSEISDEEYSEFYKFATKAYDEPRYRMHFSADAPLEINSLVFVPQENQELWGFGQMEPGVSLYCKKVLIDDKPEGLLPDWLRFLRGVIDSSDLPLNISRESMQDSALVKKLNRVVTRRFLKMLESEAKKDSEKYLDFYGKFSRFLKEGVATDQENTEGIAKLLRFESSMTDAGKLTSFAEYLDRMKEDQKGIYYLLGESRKAIEAGPYIEALKARGLEVIYLTEPIDDYVVRSLGQFKEKSLIAADASEIELDDDPAAEGEGEPLSEDDLTALCEFMKESLGDSVTDVTAGKRLISSPIAALNADEGISPQMRAMMQAMNPDEDAPPVKVKLEINPRHDLIKGLSAKRESDPETVKKYAQQMLDSALLTAGLLDDKSSMVARGYDLMSEGLK